MNTIPSSSSMERIMVSIIALQLLTIVSWVERGIAQHLPLFKSQVCSCCFIELSFQLFQSFLSSHLDNGAPALHLLTLLVFPCLVRLQSEECVAFQISLLLKQHVRKSCLLEPYARRGSYGGQQREGACVLAVPSLKMIKLTDANFIRENRPPWFPIQV